MSDGVQGSVAAETSAPAPFGHDDLVGLFKAELDAEEGIEAPSAPPATPENPSEIEPEAPEVAAEADELSRTEAETVEPGSEPPTETFQAPAINPPAGMSEADRAVFAKLPPEHQKWVSDRITGQQADFTRKTQAVAETKKNLDTLAELHLQKLQAYDAILASFEAPDVAPPDPALQITDPSKYHAEMGQYVQTKHLQDMSQKERVRVSGEQKQLLADAHRRFVADEQSKLVEMNPDFADRKKAEPMLKAAFVYAANAGYTKEGLERASAKDVMTLWKAAQYDAAQKVKATAVPVQNPAPKSVRPGPAKSVGRGTISAAVSTLSRAPSRENLAAAYLAEIASER